MELVWHNCKTHPPKELLNDDLICTNGVYAFDMTWDSTQGYFIDQFGVNEYRIEDSVLENWWWADLQQTVWNEQRFRK
jgi:hypothetical protein